jgi:hypothetical protein
MRRPTEAAACNIDSNRAAPPAAAAAHAQGGAACCGQLPPAPGGSAARSAGRGRPAAGAGRGRQVRKAVRLDTDSPLAPHSLARHSFCTHVTCGGGGAGLLLQAAECCAAGARAWQHLTAAQQLAQARPLPGCSSSSSHGCCRARGQQRAARHTAAAAGAAAAAVRAARAAGTQAQVWCEWGSSGAGSVFATDCRPQLLRNALTLQPPCNRAAVTRAPRWLLPPAWRLSWAPCCSCQAGPPCHPRLSATGSGVRCV